MTTIGVDNPVVTLINLFSVEPENQSRLLDLLKDASGTIRSLPGFVEANFHKSLDGRYVANYAQWRREDDFRAMLAHPDVQAHLNATNAISMAEPRLYRVAFSVARENEVVC